MKPTALRHFLQTEAAFMWKIRGESTRAYVSTSDFIFDRGVRFESAELTDEERAIVEAAIDRVGEPFQIKQCFYNSQLLVMYDLTRKLRYHEGYAKGAGPIPVLHAWASINGKVIDLTFRTDRDIETLDLSNRVLGSFPEGFAYLGIEIPVSDVTERCLRESSARSWLDDWENDWPLLHGQRVGPKPDLDDLDQSRNGVKVLVHRQGDGTVVETDCECFGIEGRTHSSIDCPILIREGSDRTR